MKKSYIMYRNLMFVLKDLRMDIFSSELLKSAFKLTVFLVPFAALIYCFVYIFINFSNLNQMLNFLMTLVLITVGIFVVILLFLSAFGFCTRLILSLNELKEMKHNVKVYEDKPVIQREKK